MLNVPINKIFKAFVRAGHHFSKRPVQMRVYKRNRRFGKRRV
ncbi:hypothetical protein B4098_3172 [Heyndrickxia coagulans]|uniref:Uncharacterized protein n=1 Tax=Heyndrickxia coagulans TaxID=1398 RepID=A0A150K6B1_HEYCO|nr:hypothetical protein B4099_3395 [Heyndrickxia coagulans]KYC64464.1 hypothetical protein B4098_3172 [Heyndrickxia coagulans]